MRNNKKKVSGKKKVLLVDDEPDVLRIMKLRLKSRGCVVATSPGGLEAIEKAKKMKPTVIVLDYLMPSMKGVEVCKRLKSEIETASIPVIMFTAHVAYGFETECIEAGAVGVVYKPMVSELLALIGRILGGEEVKWGEDESAKG